MADVVESFAIRFPSLRTLIIRSLNYAHRTVKINPRNDSRTSAANVPPGFSMAMPQLQFAALYNFLKSQGVFCHLNIIKEDIRFLAF